MSSNVSMMSNVQTLPYMVQSRPKSTVYSCFIKLSGILHEIDFNHKEKSIVVIGHKQK